MSSNVNIRVQDRHIEVRRDKAAMATYRYIRRHVEAQGLSNKVAIAQAMWDLFFSMKKAGLVAAPRRTKAILRRKLGFYRSIGVDETTAPGVKLVA